EFEDSARGLEPAPDKGWRDEVRPQYHQEMHAVWLPFHTAPGRTRTDRSAGLISQRVLAPVTCKLRSQPSRPCGSGSAADSTHGSVGTLPVRQASSPELQPHEVLRDQSPRSSVGRGW